MDHTGLSRVEMRGGPYPRLRAVEALTDLPPEGTVVARRSGHAVVRDGALVGISEAEAENIVDPAGAPARRYRAAVLAAGWPDRLTRIVAPAGHDWQADGAYPADDDEVAFVYCAQVQGRFVWVRACTYAEAVALGVCP